MIEAVNKYLDWISPVFKADQEALAVARKYGLKSGREFNQGRILSELFENMWNST